MQMEAKEPLLKAELGQKDRAWGAEQADQAPGGAGGGATALAA